MTTAQRTLRVVLYTVWAVLMTALTFVLAAVPLRSLRRGLGHLGYWPLCVGVAMIIAACNAPVLAMLFFSMAVLTGVFGELEELGFNLLTSAFFSLLITTMIAGGAFAFWVSYVGPTWSKVLVTYVETGLAPLVKMNPGVNINYAELTLQLPSILVIMWMIGLYLSVLMENRLAPPNNERLPTSRYRDELTELRLPDVVVWVFIAALLAAFGSFKVKGLHAVGVNTFNICLVMFFFQGIGVVARTFKAWKLNWFWQTLLMFVIVLHLFIFVSLLGLMDHWLDIRARLDRRIEEEVNREF